MLEIFSQGLVRDGLGPSPATRNVTYTDSGGGSVWPRKATNTVLPRILTSDRLGPPPPAEEEAPAEETKAKIWIWVALGLGAAAVLYLASDAGRAITQ